MQDITDKQIQEMAESMVTRRMKNTEETREQASEYIVSYLKSALSKND